MRFAISVITVFGLVVPTSYGVWLPKESKLTSVDTDQEMSPCTLCKLLVENFDNVVANSEEENVCDSLEPPLAKKCKKMLKKMVFDTEGEKNANAICAKIKACSDKEDEGDDANVSPSSPSAGAPPVSSKLIHPSGVHDRDATDAQLSSTKISHPAQLYHAPQPKTTEDVVEVSITEVYIIDSHKMHHASADQAYGRYASSDASNDQEGLYFVGPSNDMSFLYCLNMLSSFAIVFVFLLYMSRGASGQEGSIVMKEERLSSPPDYKEKDVMIVST